MNSYKIQTYNYNIKQQNALKIRDGDFDHIVDDLSDDEGDEERGRQARIEQEREDDR